MPELLQRRGPGYSQSKDDGTVWAVPTEGAGPGAAAIAGRKAPGEGRVMGYRGSCSYPTAAGKHPCGSYSLKQEHPTTYSSAGQ